MVTQFRFVHAADLHLDTPFTGIARVAPELAERLRDASLEAFDNLVELTIDRGASFLIISGDIYDGPERGLRAQLRFLRGLERLAEHQVAVFVIHGNHDPLDGWSAIRNWPWNVTVFPGDQVQALAVQSNGDRLATIYGISYASNETSENLAVRFVREDAPGIHVAILHCHVLGSEGIPSEAAAPYSPCSVADLQSIGMDYWALGHIHQRQNLAESPWIVYPGNLQGRSFKSSERGAKGAVLVEASTEGIDNIEFLPLDRIRCKELVIDIGAIADIPSLERAIIQRGQSLQEENENRDLLLQITLTGRGGLHDELHRPGNPILGDLLDAVRDEVSERRPFLWFDRITDNSAGVIDRAAIAQRSDFSGDLARMADEMAADPARIRAITDELMPQLRRARVAQWVPEIESADPVLLLRDAETRALDLLEGGSR